MGGGTGLRDKYKPDIIVECLVEDIQRKGDADLKLGVEP